MRYNSAVAPVSAACPWNWPAGVTRVQMVVPRIRKCRPDLAMRMPEQPSTQPRWLTSSSTLPQLNTGSASGWRAVPGWITPGTGYQNGWLVFCRIRA
ncbi:MAG: hypothetical protein WB870_03510 [Gallionellaceae bacterium]